jgi:formate dehydrogenase maturation protein FdhE
MARPAPPAIDAEVYSILRAVWQTYPRAATAWRWVIPPDQPTEERWAGLGDGTPLLDETRVRWDAAPLRQQYRRLLRIFRSPSLARSDALGELQRLLVQHEGEPIEWARLFLQAEVGDPRPELVIGGYIIQPFLYVFARRVLPRLNREDWRRNRCPVCGGRPYHGYLDPESRRKTLICAKCLCPWTAPRLQCPFCDNTLQELLGYYYQEQAPHHRIEYCTACRSILPITLESESNRPFPLEDHLAAMPLQVVVERSSHDDQPS